MAKKAILADITPKRGTNKGKVFMQLLAWRERGGDNEELSDEEFSKLQRLEDMWQRLISPEYLSATIAQREHADFWQISARAAYDDFIDTHSWNSHENKGFVKGQKHLLAARIDRAIYLAEANADTRTLLECFKLKISLFGLDKAEVEEDRSHKLANRVVVFSVTPKTQAVLNNIDINAGFFKVSEMDKVSIADEIDFEEVDNE